MYPWCIKYIEKTVDSHEADYFVFAASVQPDGSRVLSQQVGDVQVDVVSDGPAHDGLQHGRHARYS